MDLNNPISKIDEPCLFELFKNQKIIIPDFQRDYCWGDNVYGEKGDTDIVSGFIDVLFEEFESYQNSHKVVLLGKIDVYGNQDGYIYLTDGQQRLTTLYLIIGILYQQTSDRDLKNCLFSCLLSGDGETCLQYAIRESTVSFLQDLVSFFFISEDQKKVSEIKNQAWFFNEYNQDPSITSMLIALGIIEKILEKKLVDESSKYNFSLFLINNITVQYYDVKNRLEGEERFVIINTTGKSLTVSENIKPILLQNVIDADYANQWEVRETWFWRNRKKKEYIADDGVNDFLTWCFQIINQQEDIKLIKKAKELSKNKTKNQHCLEEIRKYFKALEKLLSYLEEPRFQTQIKFINSNENVNVNTIVSLRELSKEAQQNVLLPLLLHISKFEEDEEGCYQFLRRLRKNHFDQKWKERNDNYVDWRYVLQIVEGSTASTNILTYNTLIENAIKIIPKVDLKQWYNEEEKQKKYLPNYKIELWEDHSNFMGNLIPLFNIVTDKTDVIELESYYKTYTDLNVDTFFSPTDVKLKNEYKLIMYLKNGYFEHRSVAGLGYCMLKKTDEHLFLQNEFNELWKFLNTNRHNVFQIQELLTSKLKRILTDEIFKGTFLLESAMDNTRILGHYERVKLWAILEFFFNVNEELNFEKAICQFWEYPNLIEILDKKNFESNNYEIGNLLLGTSYTNNKSGWIIYDYPLMKALYVAQQNNLADRAEMINLPDRTVKIKNLLKDFINN